VVATSIALAGLAGAACSSSGAQSSPPVTYRFQDHVISSQARQVCSSEAAGDLAENLSVKPVSAPEPGWDPTTGAYTCTYTYADGAHFVLSVRDLSSTAAANHELTSLAASLGRSKTPLNLGAGTAFITAAGNAVVQKDAHVMVVDVSGLPASWLTPPIDHITASQEIAATIMGCWTGTS
jgi:hypothetical protein